MLQTIAAGGRSRSTRPCCNRSLRRPITCPSSPPAEPSSSPAWCAPDRLHLQSRKPVTVARDLAHVHPLGDPNDVAGYKALLNCWAGFCGHMVVANPGLIWHGHAENDPPAWLPASRGGRQDVPHPPRRRLPRRWRSGRRARPSQGRMHQSGQCWSQRGGDHGLVRSPRGSAMSSRTPSKTPCGSRLKRVESRIGNG